MTNPIVKLIVSLILWPLAEAAPQLIVALAVLAGPYRAALHKIPSFGGIAEGTMAWLGLAMVFPALVSIEAFNCDWGTALWFWAMLAVFAYLQTFARWLSKTPPRDPARGHCWVGWAEPVLALAVSYLAAQLCGLGGGLFILSGYIASLIQVGLVRLRRLYEAGRLDEAKVPVPSIALGAVDGACNAVVSTFGFFTGCATAAFEVAVWAMPALGKCFLFAFRSLGGVVAPRPAPAPAPVVAHAGVPGVPTIHIVMPHKEGFGERLRKGLVVWLIITCLTTAFSWRVVIGDAMEFLGRAFNGKVVKDGIVWGRQKADEVGHRIDDFKEDAGERIGEFKAEAAEKLHLMKGRAGSAMRRGKEEAKERYGDIRDFVTDEAGHIIRDAAGKAIFRW